MPRCRWQATWGFVLVEASSSHTGRVRPNSKLSSTRSSRDRCRWPTDVPSMTPMCPRVHVLAYPGPAVGDRGQRGSFQFIICLDDLHWAGASCAVAIRQLGPRLASLPVAWILAFRPNQGLAPVQEAKSDLIEGGAAHINLGPLKREAVALVAADVLGAQPDDDLLQRTERMRGNPFLLVEFLRGLQDDSVLKYESGRAILVGDGQPGVQSEGIRGRLAWLSPVGGCVATFASSLGLRFTLHDLAAMTSLSVGELVDPVTELLVADVFIEDGDRLSFRHDLIREAVRAGLAIPVRRGLDRQGADVLIARGALPTEVALQLAESVEPGDDVAIETVLKATQELALSDPAGAASLAERGPRL